MFLFVLFGHRIKGNVDLWLNVLKFAIVLQCGLVLNAVTVYLCTNFFNA